jgi:hypothetical protein
MLHIEVDINKTRAKRNLFFMLINFFNATTNAILAIIQFADSNFDLAVYTEEYSFIQPIIAAFIYLSALFFVKLYLSSLQKYNRKAEQYELVLARLRQKEEDKKCPQNKEVNNYNELFSI